MKDFREAAENHCIKYSIADFERGQAKTDFIYGCEHGYSEAMKEHREFYLAVREYMKEVGKCDPKSPLGKIQKHLQSFTEHEQKELPL
jgi:hypothetical protein